MKGIVWSPTSMQSFGKDVARVLDWPLIIDGPVGDCDVAYIIGMYDPPYYHKTLSDTLRAKRRVIQWCGSDSKWLTEPDMVPEAIHLASNDLYRDLVRAEGFECETLMMPLKNRFPVMPLPDEPCITTYFGGNPESYGAAYIRMLMQVFPDVKFEAFMLGQYDQDELLEVMANTSVWVQLGNDGGGHSLREAMEAGRRVITTLPLEHAVRVHSDDIPRIIREVRKALKETEPDLEAAAYWQDFNDDERFRGQFHELARI